MTKAQALEINRKWEAQVKGLDLTADGMRYVKQKTAKAWTAYLAKAKA